MSFEISKETIINAKNGNHNSINEIIKKTEKIGYILLKKISKFNIYEREDYEQHIKLWIIEAINNFDIESKIKFTTFVYYYIKGGILDLHRRDSYGAQKSKHYYDLHCEFASLKNQNPEINNSEIFKELDWSNEIISNYQRSTIGNLCIDSKDIDIELSYDGYADDVEELIVNKLSVLKLMNELSDSEKGILNLKFGLNGIHQTKVKEICKILDMPRSTLDHKYKKILKKLKKILNSD